MSRSISEVSASDLFVGYEQATPTRTPYKTPVSSRPGQAGRTPGLPLKSQPGRYNVPVPLESPVVNLFGETQRRQSAGQAYIPQRVVIPEPRSDTSSVNSLETTVNEQISNLQRLNASINQIAESIDESQRQIANRSAELSATNRSSRSVGSQRPFPGSPQTGSSFSRMLPPSPAGVEDQLNAARTMGRVLPGGPPHGDSPSVSSAASSSLSGGSLPSSWGASSAAGGSAASSADLISNRSEESYGFNQSVVTGEVRDWAGFYNSLENSLALEIAYRNMMGDTDPNRGNYRRQAIQTPTEQFRQDLRDFESERIKVERRMNQKYENGEDTTEEIQYLYLLDKAIEDTIKFLRGVPQWVDIPQTENAFPGQDVPVISQVDAIEQKLTRQPVEFQKRFEKLFFDLNQFISESVRNKAFIDTNVVFGQIRAATGDFFTDEFTNTFLLPVLGKIQMYNEGRMIGYNPQNIVFPILSPLKPTVLYTAPPPNALPGTNNEIIFENIPDGSVYSQFMGKYGNIKHPEFPLVELKFNKNAISGKFVCTQKVDGKEKSRKFDDVNQAKGWAIRGGFYADKVNLLRQSSIQDRYRRKLRVIPTIKR
jgi:hypothetical protein